MAAVRASPVALSAKLGGARKASAKRIAAPVCSLKSFTEGVTAKAEGAVKFAAGLAASALVASSANAFTYDQLQGLSYLQIKGSGTASTCSVIEGGSSDIKVPSGQYKVQEMCIEPTSFAVKDESPFKGATAQFVPVKLLTRLTYTLDDISGDLAVGSGGSVEFKEKDGIDYAATTLQLPGGERVPFLFSVKEVNAKGNWSSFGGEFTVPSYRGSSFLDPKGRGGSTGYDSAVALPAGAAGDEEKLAKENIKNTAALKGSIVLSTAVYNEKTGEVGGVFESVQPSDTDLGAKKPKDVKIQGLWYAQLVKA